MNAGGVPSPDFDETRYERPNQNWVCGNTCDGCPCRIGPSPSGECRATTECTPLLTKKEGEAKGTWKCTRPKDWGGACESGPNPDGTCCKSIPKCRPVRSIRNMRGLLTRAVIAASVGVLLIALSGPTREAFINPAPLSEFHTGTEFEKLSMSRTGVEGQGCVSCHSEIDQGFPKWTGSAMKASAASLDWSKLISSHPKDFSKIDATCLACHKDESFHAANVANDTSCSVCHLEHRGRGGLAVVTDQSCAVCHDSASEMLASANKGRNMPAAFFAKSDMPGLVLFKDQRPVTGFTDPVSSFATNHPEFRVNRPESERDGNTLAFNHAIHLTGDIPTVGGKALDCVSCHRVDASGAFMQRITFEQDCRSCHSLQFDVRNPTMEIPHGNTTFARSFLRSLPTQYADHATRKLHLRPEEVQEYVNEQMTRLRERVRTGELLEEQVFFGDLRKGPVAGIAGLDGAGRAKFAGCATCHEVTPRANSAPRVTPPVIPDRWMHHAALFNHTKHAHMACVACHDTATKSKLTSDILMPTQKSCVECHSPKGGVAHTCTECHKYHNSPPSGWSRSLFQ